MPLLDKVRAAAAHVAASATHIHINHDRIPAYADTLPIDQLARDYSQSDPYYLAGESGRATFAFVFNAINFGSGYFPHLTKRDGMSGAYTVMTCLKEWFD